MKDVLLDGKSVEEMYIVSGKGKRLKLTKLERLMIRITLATQMLASILIVVISIVVLKISLNISNPEQRLPWLALGLVGAGLGMSLMRHPVVIEKILEGREE